MQLVVGVMPTRRVARAQGLLGGEETGSLVTSCDPESSSRRTLRRNTQDILSLGISQVQDGLLGPQKRCYHRNGQMSPLLRGLLVLTIRDSVVQLSPR